MLSQLNEQKADQLAELLNVLAHPIRMKIVLDLTKPASMSALRQHLQIGQIALSQHLTTMEHGGLLKIEYRDDDIYYSLTDMALNKVVRLLLA